MLWNRSLVIRDLETGSLWSHILGECKEGSLLGARLPTLPSTIMSWKEWSTKFPNTSALLLPRTSRNYLREILDRRDEFVFGVEIGGVFKAYPLEVLLRKPVIEDELGDRPIVVAFDQESGSVNVLDRRNRGETLSFLPRLEGHLLKDTAWGGRWEPWSGRNADNRSVNARLRWLPGMLSFRSAWFTFHPNSLTAE